MRLNRRAAMIRGGLGFGKLTLGMMGLGGLWRGLTTPSRALAPGEAEAIRYLDPELRDAARMLLQSGGLNLTDEALPALRARDAAGAEPPMQEVPLAERRVPGLAGQPDVTVFVINADAARAPRPAILHTHGGGHVLGAARNELRYLQNMARDLDCVIVTVEYRLAPEVRFTGSVEDTYAALLWTYRQAEELAVDVSRIAVLGESAGGTHAALLAIAARDRGEVPLCFQALVYPMLDDRTGTRADLPPWMGAVLWDAADNRFGWTSFLGTEAGGPSVPAAGVPARVADLAGLPPAWIGVGGADLFVLEDIAYARRLTQAGVATELLVVPGAFHAFDRVVQQAAISRRFNAAKMEALSRALHPQAG